MFATHLTGFAGFCSALSVRLWPMTLDSRPECFRARLTSMRCFRLVGFETFGAMSCGASSTTISVVRLSCRSSGSAERAGTSRRPMLESAHLGGTCTFLAEVIFVIARLLVDAQPRLRHLRILNVVFFVFIPEAGTDEKADGGNQNLHRWTWAES